MLVVPLRFLQSFYSKKQEVSADDGVNKDGDSLCLDDPFTRNIQTRKSTHVSGKN